MAALLGGDALAPFETEALLAPMRPVAAAGVICCASQGGLTEPHSPGQVPTGLVL